MVRLINDGMMGSLYLFPKGKIIAGRKFGNKSGLTKTQTRIIAQNLINQYGMQKGGGSLYNQRNSIAPKFWEKYGIKF